jgi:hypothetical protein
VTGPRPSQPGLSPSGEVCGQIGPGSTRTCRPISLRSLVLVCYASEPMDVQCYSSESSQSPLASKWQLFQKLRVPHIANTSTVTVRLCGSFTSPLSYLPANWGQQQILPMILSKPELEGPCPYHTTKLSPQTPFDVHVLLKQHGRVSSRTGTASIFCSCFFSPSSVVTSSIMLTITKF